MFARDIIAEQEEEYQKCLLQDQLQEGIEKQTETEFIDSQNESEDDTKEEGENHLSPSSLRLARLRYFENKTSEIKCCECLTKKGVKCLNRVDTRQGMPGNICYIHYKALKKK